MGMGYFCNLYLMKSHRNTINSETTEAWEKKFAQLRSPQNFGNVLKLAYFNLKKQLNFKILVITKATDLKWQPKLLTSFANETVFF